MRKGCSQIILEKFFEPCILFLLLKKPSYGYELSKNLKTYCNCQVNIGNLYRGLAKLVANKEIVMKEIKGTIGPKRIMYQITEKGKDSLRKWVFELELHKKTISKLIINYKNAYG